MMTEAKSDWIKAALREHEGPLLRYATQIAAEISETWFSFGLFLTGDGVVFFTSNTKGILQNN